MDKPIGIFDSGLGGLSVLKALQTYLPNEDFVYIADTKYMPYGKKTPEQIETIVKQIIDYFLKMDVKAIIIACNTAAIISHYRPQDVPILSIVDYIIEEVLTSKSKKILLLATDLTIESSLYNRCFIDKGLTVNELKSSSLVKLVEQGLIQTPYAYDFVDKHLCTLRLKTFDSIVLACTHFKWLAPEILQVFPNTRLIDGLTEISKALKKILNDQVNIKTNVKGELKLLITGDLLTFMENIKILNFDYDEIEHIVID
jgi:glutamate racemase